MHEMHAEMFRLRVQGEEVHDGSCRSNGAANTKARDWPGPGGAQARQPGLHATTNAAARGAAEPASLMQGENRRENKLRVLA